MIPRTGRRLQSTTCKFLNPTKRRCYSTPSKKANAAASVTASASLSHDLGMGFPPFGLAPAGQEAMSGAAQPSFERQLTSFLSRPVPLTVVPPPVQGKATPLGTSPSTSSGAYPAYDVAGATAASWYTDAQTIDMTAIIDACLHNLYDVPRAHDVFKRLRSKVASTSAISSSSFSGDGHNSTPPSVLTTPMYNSFIQAYVGMAQKDEFQREYWLKEVWALYRTMESGAEGVEPNNKTYALIMGLWWKLKSRTICLHESWNSDLPPLSAPTHGQVLTALTSRNIPIMSVISHPCLDSPDVMAEIAKVLSSEAVNLGLKKVLEDLGEAVGAVEGQDILAKMHRDGEVNLDEIPEVRPVMKETQRKDIESNPDAPTHFTPDNIQNLRSTLAKILSLRRVMPSGNASDLHARQKHLEASVFEMAETRMRDEARKWKENHVDEQIALGNIMANDGQLKAWMWEWHCLLKERIQQEAKRLDTKILKGTAKASKGTKLDHAIAPYMNLLPPSVMSMLTILEVMRMQGSGGVVGGMKTARALIVVGRAVEAEWKERGGWKKPKQPFSEAGRLSDSSLPLEQGQADTVLSQAAATATEMLSSSPPIVTLEGDKDWSASWSQVTRSQVGAVLVEMLMDVAKVVRVKQDATSNVSEVVSESQPAFYQSYEYIRGNKLGIIKLNPLVLEKLATDSLSRTIHPRHLPMLVRPRSWAGVRDGGYLTRGATAMRFKSSLEQELYLREATSAGSCSLVYAGLDILGSTPWKINKGVFETVLQVWNKGERMGKLPPAVYDIEEPVLEEMDGSGTDVGAMQRKRDWGIKHKQWMQGKANNHSDRCGVNYKIEIARTFLNDSFYLPHNLDFRGRAYPIPPHLNHIGDDLSRGLLKFAEAKPLGVRGLRWLKIHLAGLCGYDKAQFDDREKWVEERIDEVRDSAMDPLGGRRWWTKADDPWQCLAACMELKAAYDLPDPTTFESSLPIHQDGTCNGLQHYAALGGDATGAAQVNLAASDRPSDVYTHVAVNVERLIDADLRLAEEAYASLSEEKKEKLEYATMLKGRVSRKVVKQTVMTTVYGVTFVGAREQIEKQLKDVIAKQKESGLEVIKEEKIWGCASYLAKKVLLSIGETFSGAKSIQTWLNLCARLISKSIPPSRLQITTDALGQPVVNLPKVKVKKEQMTSVIWTTPLGLPIVQPYRKTARKQVMTKIQSVYISDPNAPSEVNAAKQASAFPPNFIHSLDATHMMLTALECRNQNITFASVHDSYWTHGCDVDRMSAIIRDTFIALHSSDVLKKLDAEFRERYKGYKLPMDSVSASNIVKQLATAGTRIRAPLSQKAFFRYLTSIVEFTDDAPAVDGIAVSASNEVGEVKEEKKQTRKVSNSLDEELAEEDEFLRSLGEGEEGYDLGLELDPPTKSSKAENEKTAKLLAGKFIDLTDLLPPLPDKGDFDVENIKKSQYFFS